MKLPIDTSGMTFMAAAPARPVTDFDTRQHKADENGELLLQPAGRRARSRWRADHHGQGRRVIRRSGRARCSQLEGLVAMPWSMNERSGVAFRANRVKIDRRRRRLAERAGRRRRPRRRPSVMWRRSSVVHVVDELARAQRRERRRVELEALLVGLAWAAVERPRRAGRWCSRSPRFSALVGGRRSAGSPSSWSSRSVLAIRPARRLRAAAAARDACAAGVGAGDDRLGRRGRSVPVPGRVVGLARARG